MALLLNGNYIRVSKEDIKNFLSSPRFHIYKDENTRQNTSEFDLVRQEDCRIEFTDEFLNEVITEIYSKMKETERFATALDC